MASPMSQMQQAREMIEEAGRKRENEYREKERLKLVGAAQGRASDRERQGVIRVEHIDDESKLIYILAC